MEIPEEHADPWDGGEYDDGVGPSEQDGGGGGCQN